MTGRCYCGAVHINTTTGPLTVAVCHCADCRRVGGAAVTEFAAFAIDAVKITPAPGDGIEVVTGVRRWFCRDCGSPLAATFDYLPGQVYVPLGVLDQAEILTPALQSHSDEMLPWVSELHSLPRHEASARAALNPTDATS